MSGKYFDYRVGQVGAQIAILLSIDNKDQSILAVIELELKIEDKDTIEHNKIYSYIITILLMEIFLVEFQLHAIK